MLVSAPETSLSLCVNERVNVKRLCAAASLIRPAGMKSYFTPYLLASQLIQRLDQFNSLVSLILLIIFDLIDLCKYVWFSPVPTCFLASCLRDPPSLC